MLGRAVGSNVFLLTMVELGATCLVAVSIGSTMVVEAADRGQSVDNDRRNVIER